MKILFLVPPQMNIEAFVKSVPIEHESYWQFIGSLNFVPKDYDLIVYSGAAEGEFCIDKSKLLRLRDMTKLIHVSMGGGDVNWHPFLETYAKEDVFDLSVNIDGNDNWPKRSQDFTWIFPVDTSPYDTQIKKDIKLGYTAESSPGREVILGELCDFVSRHTRNAQFGYYQSYANFLLRSQCWLNMNFVNKEDKPYGINQKIIEAGLARCLLLEKKGSVASQWFIPWVDYLEYETAEDIKNIVIHSFDFPNLPINLLAKIKVKYSPDIFWNKVFNALGSTYATSGNDSPDNSSSNISKAV